jgi:hypothetical protein
MMLTIKFRSLFDRIHLIDWLILGLILLYLIPIWAFTYIPTQDGPSHLNNIQILSQYTNPAYNFQKIYDLRLTPFPNWLYNASLAGLIWIFPPLVAEKILLSLYVISFPLAFIYFLGAINPAKKPLGLFSFVFIYSYPFMMGFFSFVFSIPLAFWAFGYFWNHRSRLNFRHIVFLNLLLFLIYFGHLVVYLVVVGSIALVAGIQFLGQWFSRHGSFLRRHITSLGISLVSLVPSLSLLVYYYLGSAFAGKDLNINTGGIHDSFLEFITLQYLISYENFGQIAARIIVMVVFALLFYSTCRKRISRINFSQLRFFRFEDCLLGLFVILFVLYLILPNSFGSGGWLTTRLALLGYLFLLAWCDIPLPTFRSPTQFNSASGTVTAAVNPIQTPSNPSRLTDFTHETTKVIPRNRFNLANSHVMTVHFCLASLAMLSGVLYSFARLKPVLQEYTSGIMLIKPNTVLLPLTFLTDANEFNRTDPLLHANHYYTLTNGAVNLDNYEPFADFFPIKYKPDTNLPIYLPNGIPLCNAIDFHVHILHLCSYTAMVDYLLVWGTPDSFFKLDIERCYNLIYAKGRQKIYVPK